MNKHTLQLLARADERILMTYSSHKIWRAVLCSILIAVLLPTAGSAAIKRSCTSPNNRWKGSVLSDQKIPLDKRIRRGIELIHDEVQHPTAIEGMSAVESQIYIESGENVAMYVRALVRLTWEATNSDQFCKRLHEARAFESSARVRRLLAICLAEAGDISAVDDVILSAEKEEHGEIRAEALDAMIKLMMPPNSDAVRRAFEEGHTWQGPEALRSDRVERMLLNALNDKYCEIEHNRYCRYQELYYPVRSRAVRALQFFGYEMVDVGDRQKPWQSIQLVRTPNGRICAAVVLYREPTKLDYATLEKRSNLARPALAMSATHN